MDATHGCKICDRKFLTKGSLKKHNLDAHGVSLKSGRIVGKRSLKRTSSVLCVEEGSGKKPKTVQLDQSVSSCETPSINVKYNASSKHTIRVPEPITSAKT